jgi:hypothetical protein
VAASGSVCNVGGLVETRGVVGITTHG